MTPRAGLEVADGFTVRTQVCVIGSGAGGGVAAGRLAEAGRDVVVLEEGPHVPGARMTQVEAEMYPLLYRDGAQQFTDDGGVNVLQGRAVGGSTVVNMADVVPIPDAVLDHWAAAFGVDRYGRDTVAAAAREAAESLGAHPIAEADLNRNNALLLQGGRRVGIAGAPFVHNRVGCVKSGYCLVGCSYDAKRHVGLTWIPRALATGRCLVQTDARVDRLEHDGRRVVAAVGRLLDPVAARPLGRFRVEADHFVLAAGAVHSPALLLASDLGGRAVGRNLSLQPQAPLVATFPDDVVLWRGIPQAAFLDGKETATPSDGLGGFRLEGVGAGPAMGATTIPLWGEALGTWMREFRRSAAMLVLVPDRPGGRVVRGRDGRPKIRYPLQDAWAATMRRALRAAGEVYLAAGAESVGLPFVGAPPVRTVADLDVVDRLPLRAGSLTLISAHPQGTCRMGRDAATSVVGLDLRVHGVPNLQVLDASVFPTTSSTHTMIPTMTFALLGAGELLG